MRNLIWTGTALVLVIGAGFFVLARHAARHPTSLVARCSVAIYRMCDALLTPRGDAKPAGGIVQAPEPSAPVTVAPAQEVIEPIVIEPTDQEPPLAIPRLSPEIAAAIERLRAEEDSEAPPEAFDGPGSAPRMPYADEDVETLPFPVPDEVSGRDPADVQAPASLFQKLADFFHP
jgi:hypothetical protein